MRTPEEHVSTAAGYSTHRIALLEKAALGGAAVAFAIILSLGAKDGTLDLQLKWAIGLAVLSMPVLLALCVAKDVIVALRSQANSSAKTNANCLAAWLSVPLFALGLAIACIVWHTLGWYGAEATFLWLTFAVAVGLTVETSSVGKTRQPNSDGRNTG